MLFFIYLRQTKGEILSGDDKFKFVSRFHSIVLQITSRNAFIRSVIIVFLFVVNLRVLRQCYMNKKERRADNKQAVQLYET